MSTKDRLKLVVFICSSTGDGESPQNSLEFFRYLRRETAKLTENEQGHAFSHVTYALLGLGDSNYSKYQGAPRYLDDKLKLIGAQPFQDRTEADEATSLELVIEPWLESIADQLREQIEKLKSTPEAELSQRLLVQEEQQTSSQ